MTGRTEHVLAAIDGALADWDLPDGMRWSPAPEQVTDAAWATFDGECVPLPPQHYEDTSGLTAEQRAEQLAERLAYEEEPVQRPGYLWNGRRLEWEGTRLPDDGLSIDHEPDHEPTPEQLDALRDLADRAARQRAERDLLVVEEIDPGHVIVSRARPGEITPAQAAAVLSALGELYEGVVEGLRPVFASITDAAEHLSEHLAGLRPLLPGLAPPAGPEDRRAVALEARRRRHTGPPRPGPEQSHPPRRLAR